MRPRALDLFCGGGGAALGMIEAGFDVWGVDIEPRHAKVYPGTFVCGDATRPPFDPMDFDLVWASPPCQAFSTANLNGREYPNLIPATRRILSGHPFSVIENVPHAPIRGDVVLTGIAIGLHRLLRRRHFETSWFSMSPPPAIDRPHITGDLVTVTARGGYGASGHRARKAAGLPRLNKADAAEAMGLPMSMTQAQIGEAVPPAYARYIAESALRIMDAEKAA